MADLETRVDKIDERLHVVENKIDVLAQQVQDFVAESRAARAKTDEELKEIRTNNAALNQRMDTLNQRMDNTLLSIKNLVTATMVGIGALAVGVLAFVWTMATK